jgi:hypothetical protein
MIVVRYATLMALVIWLGGMVGARFGHLAGRFDLLSYACGGAIVVGLFVMKFIGPPPHGFIPRAAIVLLMLALTLASARSLTHEASARLSYVNIGLGLVLLVWYVRE